MSRKMKTLIIAEAGVNHNGSLDLAKQLIDVAADAKADIVKFQTFNTDDILIKSTPKPQYQKQDQKDTETQYELIKSLELSHTNFFELSEYSKKRNIIFLSTPFDFSSLTFLVEDIKMSHIKIASNEISNGPLLLQAALTKKPIILSTGMSNLSDIEAALSIIAFGYVNQDETPSTIKFKKAYHSAKGQLALKEKVILLHCTSSYPTHYDAVNLHAMTTLSRAFGLQVGYSDHTIGLEVPIAAVAMGSVVIEKHFTLSKTLKGPDHALSLEPDELRSMIQSIRHIELALGDGIKRPMACEEEMLTLMRRSLVARDTIHAGKPFTIDNLAAKQPASGISPMQYWEYVGKTASQSYQEDDIIID